MISLQASGNWGYEGKQFVARITGRDPKFTFRREFLGRKEGKRGGSTSVDVDDPGLYETRDVDRKGNVSDSYCVVLEVGGEVRQSVWLDKDLAAKIARALDEGRRIESIVSLFERPSRRDPARMVWDVELVTSRQAEAKVVARTINQATEACWQVLAALPEKEAKKVLALLRQRVSPPKSTAPVGAPGASEEQPGLTPTPTTDA